MNAIPWYRSTVFTGALTAFLMQVAPMFDANFIGELLEHKPGAVSRAIAAVVTGLVAAFRAAAGAQPLTLTQAKADAANAVTPDAKPRSFLRPLLLVVVLGTSLLVLPMLQGCEQLALQQARSFDQRYAYAMGQTTAIREAATAALKAKQITIADAEYAQQIANQSREILDAAKLVADTGKSELAQGQLNLAIAVLGKVQSYLNRRQSPDEPEKR